jgi:predicted permease
MVVQVALSLAMLILTGISVKSFWNATQIDPGFDPEGLTVASVPVGLRGYSPERTAQLYGALLSRIRSSAGVDGAALTSAVPLSLAVRLVRARVGERLLFVDTAGVTSGYFETMAIPVLQGEGFSTSDDLSAPTSVVINETMAERFWPGESPIGRSLEIGLDELRPVQIIGVAGDGRYRTLGEVPRPFIYVPLVASSTGTDTLVVRSANGVRASTQLIRDAIAQADPTLPVFAVQSMDERIGAAFLLPRYAAVLFAVLGIFATGLVLIGLYSVVDYTARQGLREFGIRVAVGASPKQIFGLVISGAVRVVLLGSSLGLVVSYLFGRLVSGILYGVEPLDLSTYLLAVFCMFLVTLLAACRPALRVVLSDPSTALRVQ